MKLKKLLQMVRGKNKTPTEINITHEYGVEHMTFVNRNNLSAVWQKEGHTADCLRYDSAASAPNRQSNMSLSLEISN